MPARIVTLTVNPAVDLATQAKSVQPGHKIRTFGERYDAGGGGINVARVISELGGETLALFASGGVTGRFVEEMLTKAKVPWQAVQIQGACRISVTVRDQSNGQEYRFIPQGYSPRRTARTFSRPSAMSKPIGWWQVAACHRGRLPTSMARQPASSAHEAPNSHWIRPAPL